MLTIETPNHYVFKTKELQVDVLGGIDFNTLDKLRVTLKIGKPNSIIAVRNSVDLYYHIQVEKLTILISERLNISSSIVNQHLLQLTELLEKHRLNQSEVKEIENELSTPTKKEALKFLKSKDLLRKTNTLIGQSGIVGEEINRLLMYLIFTSRKTNKPLHCISLGKSGLGKSHLQNSIGSLIPVEDIIEITSISANALYYFNQYELNGKVILIEDLDGATKALYPIRELQTKHKLVKTIVYKTKQGNQRTVHKIVEGKVTIAGCTTKETIYEDNSNRAFLLHLDDSLIQEEKIIKYQQSISAGIIDFNAQKKAKQLLQSSQRLLKPIKVRNPYAVHLKLPTSILKRRRTNAHYLQFIELITFYHQYQRKEKTDKQSQENYIETTLEDIKLANELILDVLVQKTDLLNNATRSYLEKLQNYLEQENKNIFSAIEIRKQLKIKKTTQWRYQKKLLDYGYLTIIKKNKQIYYQIETTEKIEDLKSRLAKELQENIKDL